MSKGSWKRPMHVSYEEYAKNYDRIFGKEAEKQKSEEKDDRERPEQRSVRENPK